MDILLSYNPAVDSICQKLSFGDLKSLSRVSKSWKEVTESILIKRTILHFDDNAKPCNIKFQRKYKNISLKSIQIERVKSHLSLEDVEYLKLTNMDLATINICENFKKLKSLDIDSCVLSKKVKLDMGLTFLKVFSLEKRTLTVAQELIKTNDSIHNLNLNIFPKEDNFVKFFNDFLQNIFLPKLHTFAIQLPLTDLYCGLKKFLKNHTNILVCTVNGKLPTLERFSLEKLLRLMDEPFDDLAIISFIAETLPKLKVLNLENLYENIEENKPNMVINVSSFKNLEKLELDKILLIDKFLRSIRAPKLKDLVIKYSYLKFEGIKGIVENTAVLRVLTFVDCIQLEKSVVTYLFESMLTLQKVVCCIGDIILIGYRDKSF